MIGGGVFAVTDKPDKTKVSTLVIGNVADASVAENAAYSAAPPSVSGATGAVSWSLEGADAARFTVDANEVISVVAQDFEAPGDADTNWLYAQNSIDAGDLA